MPYVPNIPAEDRTVLDKKVYALSDELTDRMKKEGTTAGMSVLYRNTFNEVGDMINAVETGKRKRGSTNAEKLATAIVGVAEKYNYEGAWLGELNYATTRLIQATPLMMVEKQEWKEPLRYWIYAQTTGSLVGAAKDADKGNDPVSNGLIGVFVDIKDEYKRRVNVAYEAAQIIKSGDCYELSPFRTELMALDKAGAIMPIKNYLEGKEKTWMGFQEVMLPKQELSDLLVGLARMK